MKKVVLFATATLALIAVAVVFLKAPKEASDVVIILEKDAPSVSPTLPSISAAPTQLKTEVTPSAGTTVTDEQIKEIDEITAELETALEELPTIENLKDLDSHDVHHTPQSLKEGGVLIGSMLKKAQADPVRRKPTLDFFLRCAEDDNLVPPVRAVCWNSLLTRITEWEIFFPISTARVPPSIKSLAAKLR